MNVTVILVAIVAAVLLVACGGGGGGSSNGSASAQPPTIRSAPLRFGYYSNYGEQITETADHVGFVFLPDEGNWDLPDYLAFRTNDMVQKLQQAKALGVKEAWLMVGFLLFDGSKAHRLRPDAAQRVAAFKGQLISAGLDRMVTVLYPMDEPDLNGPDANTLTSATQVLRAIWPEAKVAVTYSDSGRRPAQEAFDLVGLDKYEAGAGVLSQLPPLGPGQQRLLFPGGSNPWRQDPQPFVDYGLAHGDVYAIVAFMWADGYSGNRQPGIRSNGLAPAYRAAGFRVQ